jgi:hypothetical protein
MARFCQEYWEGLVPLVLLQEDEMVLCCQVLWGRVVPLELLQVVPCCRVQPLAFSSLVTVPFYQASWGQAAAPVAWPLVVCSRLAMVPSYLA